jgi:cytidyltransferase-like protein
VRWQGKARQSKAKQNIVNQSSQLQVSIMKRSQKFQAIIKLLVVLLLEIQGFNLQDFTTRTTAVVPTWNRDGGGVGSCSSRRRSAGQQLQNHYCTTTRPATRPTMTRLYAHVDDYKHTLAILSMPSTSTDRIANEAILNTAVQHTRKLSVVLRCDDDNDKQPPSLAKLRQYVGEVYSTLWDVAMSATSSSNDDNPSASEFCDVVVYPQNLPNAAPESWIHVAPDLDSVCSHDSICGWVSVGKGRGQLYEESQGDGMGGLDAHVAAMNAERTWRNLPPVIALHVDPWPKGASAEWQHANDVVFLDDEITDDDDVELPKDITDNNIPGGDQDDSTNIVDDGDSCNLIGGARIPTECLFDEVAVGGTFDGMHYGHRKLLTLAVSSVNPATGKLLIGVTVDDMLQHKSYSEQIPTMKERMDGAREFVYRLAPGIKNRVKLRPIADEYGPLGTVEEGSNFDALVLSHETLDNGHKLNEYRKNTLGLPPVALLCTRRTEPHGMSSTALRRRKWERKQRRKAAAAASTEAKNDTERTRV